MKEHGAGEPPLVDPPLRRTWFYSLLVGSAACDGQLGKTHRGQLIITWDKRDSWMLVVTFRSFVALKNDDIPD
ncbi:hypothetical protein PIB30_095518, partial [Stylosanthes scabra]|nr:hypothetical protein [Stylosanthes scabra]